MFSTRARAVEHDLRRAELITAVDDRDLAANFARKIASSIARVAAADDHRALVAEEGRVAGRAVARRRDRRAPPRRARRASCARRPSRGSPCGRGARRRRPRRGARRPARWRARRASPSSVIEARAEALGLVADLLHHLRAHDPLGEARVVLDVGGLLEQAAPEEALDDERPQVRARRVERCGVAGRPAADDDRRSRFLLIVPSPLGSVRYFTLYSSRASPARDSPGALGPALSRQRCTVPPQLEVGDRAGDRRQPEGERAVGRARRRPPGRRRRRRRRTRRSCRRLPRRPRPASAACWRACRRSSPSRSPPNGGASPKAWKAAHSVAMSKPHQPTAPEHARLAVAHEAQRGAHAAGQGGGRRGELLGEPRPCALAARASARCVARSRRAPARSPGRSRSRPRRRSPARRDRERRRPPSKIPR